ncbi:hypothetical protein ISCGN_021550 [Ixodes scapularis]
MAGFTHAPTSCDPVGSLLISFHQPNSSNDRVDARTAVFTAENLNFGVQVGILKAAGSGKSPSSLECQAAMKRASSTRETRNTAVPETALGVPWKIQHLMKYNEVQSELEFAPLTCMAGYLAFVCEQR